MALLTRYRLEKKRSIPHSLHDWSHCILILVDGHHTRPRRQSNSWLEPNHAIPICRIRDTPECLLEVSTVVSQHHPYQPARTYLASNRRGSQTK